MCKQGSTAGCCGEGDDAISRAVTGKWAVVCLARAEWGVSRRVVYPICGMSCLWSVLSVTGVKDEDLGDYELEREGGRGEGWGWSGGVGGSGEG